MRPALRYMIILTVMALIVQEIPLVIAQDFECSVIDTNTQTCDGVIVLRMSAKNNAHAEMPTQSNYDYAVCCKSATDTLGVDTSGSCSQGKVVSLSALTNAHAGSYDDYLNKICLNALVNGKISCRTISSGSCSADEVCLFSMSAATDAHVGECTAYQYKVCCGYNIKTASVNPIMPTGQPYLTVFENDYNRLVLLVENPTDYQVRFPIVLDSNTPEIARNSYFSGHRNDPYRHNIELILQPHQKVYVPVDVYGHKEGLYPGKDGIYFHDGSGDEYASVSVEVEKKKPGMAVSTPGMNWYNVAAILIVTSALLALHMV